MSLWIVLGFGQNKSRLEKEKQESLRKIKETEKIIQETKTLQKATMGQLTALSKQIEARQELIQAITKEIHLLNQEIEEKESVIASLQKDLEDLQNEYAAMIYAAAKMDNSFYKLTFIFSAGSFNQMLMRIKYFQQYSDARHNQLEQIELVKASLANEKLNLQKKRAEQNRLLMEQTAENDNLNNLKKEKNAIVKELSQKEIQLKKELEETKKALKELENKIREIIEEERKRALAEAAEKAKNEKNKTGTKNSATEGKELVSAFSGNMNRLPWPVSNGTIVRKYGRQRHPVLGIEENNLGVGIQTLKGEQVRAVFSGKVISITEIPGMNKIVMIQHGDFFTVYARLKKVYVKKDQEVNAKDLIGEVYTNTEEVSLVEFQIWQGNNHLDPELWLSKNH
jgi:septal ring factor EnvC (AmiA/AmiB activator)